MKSLQISSNKNIQDIVQQSIRALKQGKVIVYPTDTSYGLGALVSNPKAISRLYKIKQRGFNKPVHVVVPSVAYAKKIVKWNMIAQKLANKFWPGALSIVLPLKSKKSVYKKLTAGTGYLGLRIPKNDFVQALVKKLGQPITTTSANPAGSKGGKDSYAAQDIMAQFKNKKFKPDLIIDAGSLPIKKPSTFVKIEKNALQILRVGPISEKEIWSTLLA